MDVARSLGEVRGRIASAATRAGRAASEVALLAVTKTVPVEAVRALYGAGQRLFGENRVAAAAEKIAALDDLADAEWHMVGHLQRNKARKALEIFGCVHSVESGKLLAALEKALPNERAPLDVYVEVNVAGEAQKYGLSPDAVEPFLGEAARCERVRVTGLMTMAPFVEDGEASRAHFARLRELREEANARGWYRGPIGGLSMGMTQDYEVAVEEGATVVRVGSALFR